MQTKQDGRLGTEKIGKLMLELALPSVLAQIVKDVYKRQGLYRALRLSSDGSNLRSQPVCSDPDQYRMAVSYTHLDVYKRQTRLSTAF